MIEHLENEVRDELEASRRGQKRAVAVMHVNGDRIEVLGRIGPSGGIRLENVCISPLIEPLER